MASPSSFRTLPPLIALGRGLFEVQSLPDFPRPETVRIARVEPIPDAEAWADTLALAPEALSLLRRLTEAEKDPSRLRGLLAEARSLLHSWESIPTGRPNV